LVAAIGGRLSKLPFFIADSDDRANFDVEERLGEPRRPIGEFKIPSVEKIAIGGMRNNKKSSYFGAVRQGACSL
jgi:hypothetical protein